MTQSMQPSKKELIRRAALQRIAKNGFHNTTASQIAAEAGVAVGTLYNHFVDKEDIMIHIFEVEMAERQAAVAEITSRGLPMREEITAVLKYHFERASQNPFFMRLFLGEELHLGGKLERCTHQLFKEIPDKVAAMLQSAMDRGELRRADPQLWAHAMMGASRTVIARAFLYDDEGALRFRKIAPEALGEFIWQGIRPEVANHSGSVQGAQKRPTRLVKENL